MALRKPLVIVAGQTQELPVGDSTNVTVVDAAADTTCWPMLATAQTGDQQPATDAGLSYNASTNVLTTGELSTNGTAGGLEIANANSLDAYQATIGGSMTLNSASINAVNAAVTITGGAATTNMRGLLLNNVFTPTANANIYSLHNQFTLNSGASPVSVYGDNTSFILGASALGGTIANYYGKVVGFSANAAATTNITSWVSYVASNIANGALQTVSKVYGFYGVIASGTDRWNCYMAGTADNAFNGHVRVGGITVPVAELDVTGEILATTFIRSSGATSGIGYSTGSGGTVTQATSKATGVTLNKVTGKITMNGAALAAGAIVSFVLTDSAIEAEDQLNCTHHATGTFGAYVINSRCALGSATIDVTNISAGSLSEAIVIKYNLFKSVAA